MDVPTFHGGDGLRAEARAASAADSPLARLSAAQVAEAEGTGSAGSLRQRTEALLGEGRHGEAV